jgi:NADH-quinone oxidoreductase subunit G
LHLLGKLVRGLGSDNIDHRLRHSDFSADGTRQGAPWLGMKVAEINQLDRLLLVGSFLRKDHPLIAARVRAATKRGCQVSVVHAADDALLMPVAAKLLGAPQAWTQALAEVAAAVAAIKGVAAPVAGITAGEAAQAMARSLTSGERKAVWLGNAAVQAPNAAQVQALAQWIAQATGARFGVLGEAANSVGAYLVDALPVKGGMHARAMIESPRQAVLLWNFEPEYDTANGAAMMKALRAAQTVIAFSAYRNGAMEYADAILPITPSFETSGTFVNTEGRVQTFNGAVRPLGDARPGWKVLRVLGSQLGLGGFDYETPEAVRAELPTDVQGRLGGTIAVAPSAPQVDAGMTQRVADVPVYFSDAMVRRSAPLQQTADARPPVASANARTLAQFRLNAGDKARAVQDGGSALVEVALDERLPDGVVRVPAGHAATSTLGAMFGAITLERA